jgi:hypothetical protein
MITVEITTISGVMLGFELASFEHGNKKVNAVVFDLLIIRLIAQFHSRTDLDNG